MEQEQQREPFSFSGQGGEYFRIWIVNLCLSLITLGIYSAWAKVRRLQYFHRHTSVAGASLDYHGNPIAILKGRLLAVTLFAIYSLVIKINPIAGLAVFAFIMAVMPWLLVRSFRFKLQNTSYRGLRFSFQGGIGEGYINFLLMPLVSYMTAGLLWPLAHQQITRYVRNHSTYGNGRFTFHAKSGAFYRPYLMVFAAFIAIILAAMGAAIALTHGSGQGIKQIAATVIATLILVYLSFLLIIVPYLSARLQNIIWNNTMLGPLGFECDQRARDVFGIMFVNILLIILTLGLFKPFADIRLARYRVEHLTLLANADIEAFVAEQQAEVSATGEEMADIFDMDISV